jgi:hypothetical protein
LIRKLRHLDRRPDIEYLATRIPLRGDAEGFDRHCRAAAPAHAQRNLVFGFREGFIDRAPDEAAVKQHVAAVRRMHLRAVRLHGNFGIDHLRRLFVFDFDQLDRIFGDRARIRDHRSDPFAAVTHDVFRQGITRHLGRIDANRQRIGGGAEFLAGQYMMYARQR